MLALENHWGNKNQKQLAGVEALLGSIAWPTDHPALCKVTSRRPARVRPYLAAVKLQVLQTGNFSRGC